MSIGAVARVRAVIDRRIARVPLLSWSILLVGTLVAVLAALDWHSPIRVLLSLAFLLFGPGLLLAEVLQVNDSAVRMTVAFAGSVAIATLVALGLVYGGVFSAGTGLGTLLGICVILLILDALTPVRSSERRKGPSGTT